LLAASLPSRPEVVTLGGTTIAGILDDVARVAAAIGVAGDGEELSAALLVRLRRIHTKLKSASAPRPPVAVIEWTSPVYAAGHWVPEMVRRAGGTDVLAAAGEHSRPRHVEEIAAAHPQHVIFAQCGYGIEAAVRETESLRRNAEWRWLDDCIVWALDANRLTSRPGPHVVDGVETVAGMIHPAIFPTPDRRLARRISFP
jgi:iron complex transport system substrate-binding protein